MGGTGGRKEKGEMLKLYKSQKKKNLMMHSNLKENRIN